MNSLVSVIVPVYNVAQYLEQCLESLRQQSYRDLEIMMVDDGSTDGSGEIAASYAKKDSRFQLIRQVNSGLSVARNTGIKRSHGSYLAFVDSDDYVQKDFIKKLVQAAERQAAPIAACGLREVADDGQTLRLKRKRSTTLAGRAALNDIFQAQSELEMVVWNKLYERAVFLKNEIWFPPGKNNEDNWTTPRLLFAAEKVVLIPDALYCYRQRAGSIIHSPVNKREVMDKLECLRVTKKWLEQEQVAQDVSDFDNYAQAMRFAILDRLTVGRNYDSKLWQPVIEQLVRNHNQSLSRKNRWRLAILRCGRPCYILARRIFARQEKGSR